jgi:DNA-binding transcriptional MerR regulator
MADMPGPSDAAPHASVRGEASTNGPRAAKSAGAFRTISEVAGELNVPQHVLRFWETKFSQVKPLKRGGGRRYYRPEDVELLRSIRALLYNDGYTIKGVQKLLREGGTKSVRNSQPDGDAPDVAKERHEAAVGAGLSASRADQKTAASVAVAGMAVPSANRPLDPETRASLKTLLGELQALRDLLQK